jgi:hypothetical protein
VISPADFESDGPQFIAVDLEIRSREDLTLLAGAFDEKGAFIQFNGRVRGRFLVSVSSNTGFKKPSAEKKIRSLLGLVKTLPPVARRLWRRAESRTFDVGFESGAHMALVHETPPGSGVWSIRGKRRTRSLNTSLKPEIVRAIASVGGTLAITIYPPRKMVRSKRR